MKEKNIKILLTALVILVSIITVAVFLLFSLLINTNRKVYDLEIERGDTVYVNVELTAIPDTPTPEPTLYVTPTSNVTPTPYVTAQPVVQEEQEYEFDFEKRVDANPYMMGVQIYMDADEAQEILGYPSKIEQKEMPLEGIGGIRTICTYPFGRVEYNSDTMDYLTDGHVMSVVITEENQAGINDVLIGDDVYDTFYALGLDEDMVNNHCASFGIDDYSVFVFQWHDDKDIYVLDIICSDYNHIMLTFAFENDKVIEIVLTHEYY